jgi:hypothetical protein
MTTGFNIKNNLLSIDKDPKARLTYALDWSQWLMPDDSLSLAEFIIHTRLNDPKPLLNAGDGIQGSKTYIELYEGQLDKTYTVSVKITTTNGLVERRNFRVNIINRSA